MVKLYQFRVSARRRARLFAVDRVRRGAIHLLVRLLSRVLVSFSLVIDHGHFNAFYEEKRVNRLRGVIRRRLSGIVGVQLEPVWHDVVDDELHARSLLRYDADQVTHHDLPGDPALFDGSFVQDMLGARALPGRALRVTDAVPEFRVRWLCGWVGLPPAPIEAASDEVVRALGVQRLTEAATSATAADPELRGRHAPEVRAKRVVAWLAREAGIQTADVQWALKLTKQGVAKLRARPPDPAAMRATRVRLSLEEVVREIRKNAGRGDRAIGGLSVPTSAPGVLSSSNPERGYR